MAKESDEQVLNKVMTVPNLITLIRFLLIPLFLWLVFGAGQQAAGLVVYAIASCTDWVDGQVARRTGQVSKLGKLFDPAVDRLLLASGVITVCVLGRLPLWVVVLLVARDVVLLAEGQYLLRRVGQVPPVIYVGKFCTAFLMFGYCLLLLGAPMVPGLGFAAVDVSWLPGLGPSSAYLGIYFVYIGIILSIVAFTIYQVKGIRMLLKET